MSTRSVLSSDLWVSIFERNAKSVTSEDFKPPATIEMPASLRAAIAESLPAWQLGGTSLWRHLRAVARRHAIAQRDLKFLEAVELFIKEEQRHCAALGDWLDRVGIARKSCDRDDRSFQLWRHAIPNYSAWAAIGMMTESMAEIYYASVRHITPCLRLQSECDRILRDKVRHIQFQCEHLAIVRRWLPCWIRKGVEGAELVLYVIVSATVYAAHGRVLRLAGLSAGGFASVAAAKFRFLRVLSNPERYSFPSTGPRIYSRRVPCEYVNE